MTSLSITNHALLRLAQRGFVPSDLELILTLGSEVEDGILVLRSDVKAAEENLRAMIRKLQKIEGKRLVVVNGHLVTAFHASKRETCKLTKRDFVRKRVQK